MSLQRILEVRKAEYSERSHQRIVHLIPVVPTKLPSSKKSPTLIRNKSGKHTLHDVHSTQNYQRRNLLRLFTTEIMKCKLTKVTHDEYEQNLLNG
jgi:hypothetical protein